MERPSGFTGCAGPEPVMNVKSKFGKYYETRNPISS
jgi:hypothetical protein